jgi:hypothetical protein
LSAELLKEARNPWGGDASVQAPAGTSKGLPWAASGKGAQASSENARTLRDMARDPE